MVLCGGAACSAVARHGHDMAMRRLDLAVPPGATWTDAGQWHASVSACGFHASGFGLSYHREVISSISS